MVNAVVPENQLALSEKPQTQIDASAFNRPLQVGIGSGLEQLGSGVDDLAVSAAKDQAQDDIKNAAVTLDANGIPQIATPANSIILGKAGQDYQESWAVGMKARLASNVQEKLTEIHLANEDNPQGFKDASDAYANGLRNSPTLGPKIGNALADQASSEGAQRLANIQEKMFEIGTRDDLQAVQTQIANTQNKMGIIARNGGIGTAEYQKQQGILEDYYSHLAGNKLFGYSKERADSELQTALSSMKGEAILSAVEATFKRTGGDGGRAGAQKMLDQKLDDPDLHLSLPERDQFKHQGMARLDYLTSDDRAHINASRVATDKIYTDMITGKVDMPQVIINQALAQAQSVHDSESVLKLSQAAAHYGDMKALRGLTDEQRLRAVGAGQQSDGAGGSEKQALDFFVSKGWSQEQAAGIVGNLVRESGLRAGATNKGDGSDGSDSIGLGQWNGSRAVALKAFAGAQGKSVNDFGTQLAFVQHELETSESGAAGTLRKATTAQDAASAFALGYERPQGFMTGDINQVAGGKDRVAAAMRLAGGGASSAVVPTGAISSGRGPVPVPSAAEMKANPYAISVYSDMLNAQSEQDIKAAKSVGETLATQFGSGNVPDPQITAGFFQMAAQHPDQLGELSQKVNAQWFANVKGGAALATMTPAAAQSYADQVTQAGQGGPIFQLKRAEALQDFIKKGAENLKNDQFNESVRRGWIAQMPQSLDFTRPDTLSVSIAQHAAAATAIGSHTQDAAKPIFAGNEVPQVKSVMTGGTLDQRMALLGAIANAGMPEPVLRATLQQLAGAKETLPLAVAGSLVKDAPDAARNILQGQLALQTEPKLAPNKDDFPGELAKAIPFNDLAAGPAREGIDGAVQAYYAKLSADAGDTTGIINAARLTNSIDAVTGGIGAYRGSKVVAPWYGAGQEGLDSAVRTLTDADFKGAQTTDGKPFPASALKPSFAGNFTFNNWRLQSYGDGKYLVFSGADDRRQYLSNGQGGKFILNLGAKRTQAERAGIMMYPSVYGAAVDVRGYQ